MCKNIVNLHMTIKKNNEDGQRHYVKHYMTSVREKVCVSVGEWTSLISDHVQLSLRHLHIIFSIQYSGAVFCSNDFRSMNRCALLLLLLIIVCTFLG